MKRQSIPFVLLCFVMLASCRSPRYAYSPSAHNVPVLAKKGDSKLGILYSTSPADDVIDDRSRGIDAQGAIAITDHFAIQGSYFYRWEKTKGGDDSATVRYIRNLGELGIGYYIPLTPKKNIIFQLFGGAGIGKFSFTDNSKNGFNYHDADITKIYVQPAFIFRSPGSFSSSLSMRTSLIQFRNIKTSYSYNQLSHYRLDSLSDRAKWFFEPAFTGSFGFKGLPGLRIEFQGSVSLLLTHNRYIDYRFSNFSIGTWFDIGKMARGDKR
ncbi:MAG: hypothetical protein U0T79_15660 [Ferruginibacter sp.]